MAFRSFSLFSELLCFLMVCSVSVRSCTKRTCEFLQPYIPLPITRRIQTSSGMLPSATEEGNTKRFMKFMGFFEYDYPVLMQD